MPLSRVDADSPFRPGTESSSDAARLDAARYAAGAKSATEGMARMRRSWRQVSVSRLFSSTPNTPLRDEGCQHSRFVGHEEEAERSVGAAVEDAG